jgi:ketosteroid isomerase-like protein
MKNSFTAILLLIVNLLLSCQQQEQTNIKDEKASVKKTLDNYVKSIVDEDMDLYSEIVAHDSNMINIGGGNDLSWIEGWVQLKDVMNGQNDAFSETKIDVTKERIFVSPSGRDAWAVTLWNLKTVLSDGNTYLLPLRCTWVLQKRNDKWIIVSFHKSFGIKSLKDFQVTDLK